MKKTIFIECRACGKLHLPIDAKDGQIQCARCKKVFPVDDGEIVQIDQQKLLQQKKRKIKLVWPSANTIAIALAIALYAAVNIIMLRDEVASLLLIGLINFNIVWVIVIGLFIKYHPKVMSQQPDDVNKYHYHYHFFPKNDGEGEEYE